MTTDEELLAEIREKSRTQVRTLEVFKTNPRDSQFGGGVSIRVPLSTRASTVIDLNIHEVRAWATTLMKFADQHHEGDKHDH